MKKIIVIGDSNQTNLITVKLAFLLSCPVYSGEKEKANRAIGRAMASAGRILMGVNNFVQKVQTNFKLSLFLNLECNIL